MTESQEFEQDQQAPTDTRIDTGGCGEIALPLLIAGLASACLISVSFEGAGFSLLISVYPVVLLISAAIGVPLYWIAAARRRVNLLTAAAAGLFTGAILPAALMLPDLFSRDYESYLEGLAWFGGAGVVGGVVFRFIVWLAAPGGEPNQ